MALIMCRECGKEVSDKATACPHCGFSISSQNNSQGLIIGNVIDTERLHNENNLLLKEIIEKYPLTKKKKMIKELRERKSLTLEEANEVINAYIKDGANLLNLPNAEFRKTFQDKQRKKSMDSIKSFLVFIGILFLLVLLFGGNKEEISNETVNVQSQNDTTDKISEELAKEESQENNNPNFKSAVEAIGMNYSNVKNISKLDDWASGPRYSFVYDGFEYIVYELDNKEINTIVTSYKRAAIYERGYEPLNYKDFEPDKSVISNIQSDAINQMTKYINGTKSLDIKTGSMMYARIYDYYSISGEIKAKNAIDKEVYTFTADYMVEDNSFECVYLAIDGNIVHGTEDFTPELPKVELAESVSETKSDCIVLSDGKVGEYGQYDLFDGEEYIRYYVPTGDYNVKCNIRGGFYIETIELHKENGWDTPTTIRQIDIKPGEEINITVDEGQCISLYINTEIELYQK